MSKPKRCSPPPSPAASSRRSASKKSKPKTKADSSGPLRTHFSAAQLLRRFHQLLPASLLTAWLALSDRTFYERAFTPLICLWYLIFQRLSDNHHLSHVVQNARDGGADGLSPKGKRLSQQLAAPCGCALWAIWRSISLPIGRATAKSRPTGV